MNQRRLATIIALLLSIPLVPLLGKIADLAPLVARDRKSVV